ncbi:MAG: hypothetical protein ACKOSO_07920 [Actinomycetota bacterium]
MSAEHSTGSEIAEPMTQLDYASERLEERDSGVASASALLSGLGAGLGVLSIYFAPMILGFVAIGAAILGLAIAGDRDRFAKIALIIATVGWRAGSIIAGCTGASPLSLKMG